MRPKKAFLSDPDALAEFVIAARLHMTVARLREEMPALEFAWWVGFLNHEAWQREQRKG